MIRIHKVTTRSGDQGRTSLTGGKRVGKESLRVESFGTLEELQASLGLLKAALKLRKKPVGFKEEILRLLTTIQNRLFDAGLILSCPSDRNGFPPSFPDEEVFKLETKMKEWNKILPPLSSFLLPGGGELSSRTHLCRTVCRRAERTVVRLKRREKVPDTVLRYLNRLSDFLFVLGRFLAHQFGEEEELWEIPKTTSGPP